MGRFFSDEDDRVPSTSAVAVISDRYWRQRLSAEPGIVGKTIRITEGARTRVVLDALLPTIE